MFQQLLLEQLLQQGLLEQLFKQRLLEQGTTTKQMFVPTIIVETVVSTMIVGTAVPTIIVLTTHYWKSCVREPLSKLFGIFGFLGGYQAPYCYKIQRECCNVDL